MVIKLPIGKNQWRKLGALKGESRETNKDHTEELSASIQWEFKNSHRHFYILEQLDYSAIKYDYKAHFTWYLGKNSLPGFEN